MRERPLTTSHHLQHLAQLTGLQTRTQTDDRRVIPLNMPHPGDKTARSEGLGQQARRLDRVGQRLLNQGVHTGLGQRESDRFVQRGRTGHHRIVQTQTDQLLDRADEPHARRSGPLVGHRVGDADQINAFKSTENPGVVTTHRAKTNQTGAELRCCHICSKAFTASATRSRSSEDKEG